MSDKWFLREDARSKSEIAWKATMRYSIGNAQWRGIFGTSEAPPDEMQPLFDLQDEAKE